MPKDLYRLNIDKEQIYEAEKKDLLLTNPDLDEDEIQQYIGLK